MQLHLHVDRRVAGAGRGDGDRRAVGTDRQAAQCRTDHERGRRRGADQVRAQPAGGSSGRVADAHRQAAQCAVTGVRDGDRAIAGARAASYRDELDRVGRRLNGRPRGYGHLGGPAGPLGGRADGGGSRCQSANQAGVVHTGSGLVQARPLDGAAGERLAIAAQHRGIQLGGLADLHKCGGRRDRNLPGAYGSDIYILAAPERNQQQGDRQKPSRGERAGKRIQHFKPRIQKRMRSRSSRAPLQPSWIAGAWTEALPTRSAAAASALRRRAPRNASMAPSMAADVATAMPGTR